MSKTLRSPRQRQLLALLVQARQGRGLTQAQVAARLRKPQSSNAKVEGGKRRLDVIEFIDLGKSPPGRADRTLAAGTSGEARFVKIERIR